MSKENQLLRFLGGGEKNKRKESPTPTAKAEPTKTGKVTDKREESPDSWNFGDSSVTPETAFEKEAEEARDSQSREEEPESKERTAAATRTFPEKKSSGPDLPDDLPDDPFFSRSFFGTEPQPDEPHPMPEDEEEEGQAKKASFEPDDFVIEPEEETESDALREKTIYFSIVLDRTPSMISLYKAIYTKLTAMIDSMDRAVRNYKKKGQVELKWGLVLITENEPEVVSFVSSEKEPKVLPFSQAEKTSKDSFFTASPDRIKEALQAFSFYGGSPDGRENINGALEVALRTLSEASDGLGKRGILLLTDSLPQEEDLSPDFEFVEGAECTTLRFVHCFVQDCLVYEPYFSLEDKKEGNCQEIRNLEAYLNHDEDEVTARLLKKILHQTSVSIKNI